MGGLITWILVTVIVFAIFGRDEEGHTRSERRQMKKARRNSCPEVLPEQTAACENRVA